MAEKRWKLGDGVLEDALKIGRKVMLQKEKKTKEKKLQLLLLLLLLLLLADIYVCLNTFKK